MSEPIIESGLQVITRLIDRPSIEELDNDLFFNKVQNTDVIEIKGTVSTDITMFLTKLIAKCILPLKYNGLNIGVLFINTENQFQVSRLFKIMEKEVCDIVGPVNVESIVKETLNDFKIINCYNHQQLLVTLNSLDNIFLKYKQVGLIIIDSISAYYWQQKDDLSYNSYFLKLINIVRKVTSEFKVLTLFTKQFNFESKKQTAEWNEGKKMLRYEICLTRNEKSNDLICNVKSGKDNKILRYKINETGIEWIVNKK